jgi:hypothetical protein
VLDAVGIRCPSACMSFLFFLFIVILLLWEKSGSRCLLLLLHTTLLLRMDHAMHAHAAGPCMQLRTRDRGDDMQLGTLTVSRVAHDQSPTFRN